MTIFTPKKMTPENNWGDELRQARLFKNLRIEEVAKKIHIRGEYLIALEEERLDRLPAGLYGKNFLKEYADFLGLDAKKSLTKLNEKINSEQLDDPFSQKIVKKRAFISFPKIIRNILISFGLLICCLYLIFYFKKIVFPPRLEVTQPSQNILSQETLLIVNGETEKEAEIKINGELILNNHDGFFSQAVNLKKGLNNIIITAKKKYSQEKTVIRQVLVE